MSETLSFDFPDEEQKTEQPQADFAPFGNNSTEGTDFQFPAGEESNGGFSFSFDSFPQNTEQESAFVFDANEEKPEENPDNALYEQFLGLIANPCFEYTGKPLDELFKYEFDNDTPEKAFEILVGEKTQ